MVTVYSKPSCVQCNATYRALDKKGIAYEVVDMSMDPDALDYVKSLGFQQAPVVVAGESDDLRWSGFNPGKIEALAAS